MDTGRKRGWPLTGRAADTVLTAVTAAAVIGTPMVFDGPGAISLAGYAVMAAASAAVFFRRDYPLTVTVVTFAASVAYLLMPDPDGPIVLTFAIGLYTLMADGKFVPAVLFGAVTVVLAFYGEFTSDTDNLGEVGVLFFAGWIITVLAIGGAVYNRRAYLAEAEQRARDAERNRDEELRRRTTEERLRIARELHDVLGHSISLINVQASAALHRLPANPEQAGNALSTIKETSHEALRELRHTLGVLRQVDEDAPTAPAPGLAQVGELVSRAETAELRIRAEIDTNPERAVPPAVDLVGYRIVQEALTNVARHAGATTATVRVRYRTEDVEIEIEDDGRGEPSGGAGTGSGIVGMRERAVALGGELSAGPGPAGGFRVHARLPVRGADDGGQG